MHDDAMMRLLCLVTLLIFFLPEGLERRSSTAAVAAAAALATMKTSNPHAHRPSLRFSTLHKLSSSSSAAAVTAAAASIHIPIVYETDQLIVFDKPAGISHHDHDEDVFYDDNDHDNEGQQKEGRGSKNTSTSTTTLGILSLVALEYPRLVASNASSCSHDDDDDDDTTPRQRQRRLLYGVHRLDQVTSGLLVVAKTRDMARRLTLAFTNRNVTKYYTGLSLKSIAGKKKKQGWVKGYMVRGRRKSWYLTKQQQPETSSSSSASSSSSSSSAASWSVNGDEISNSSVPPTIDSSAATTTVAVWAQRYFWTAGLGHLVDQYQQPPILFFRRGT
jgi:23S rRNA-/tRNA-specific pseudouridylate synthase